jgi:hypothetical protein
MTPNSLMRLMQVKQGVEIEKLESDGMVFKDGSRIQADVIILAYVQSSRGYVVIIGIAGLDMNQSSPMQWPSSARGLRRRLDLKSGA